MRNSALLTVEASSIDSELAQRKKECVIEDFQQKNGFIFGD